MQKAEDEPLAGKKCRLDDERARLIRTVYKAKDKYKQCQTENSYKELKKKRTQYKRVLPKLNQCTNGAK